MLRHRFAGGLLSARSRSLALTSLSMRPTMASVISSCRANQQAVARGVGDAPRKLGQLGIDQLPKMDAKRGERAFFVQGYQTRVAGHISGNDGCQSAVRALDHG